MKKIFIKLLAVALLLTTVAIACKKEPVQGVIIDSSSLIIVGETVTLTPTFVPSNAHNKKVSWKSSNPNIATVDNGKVTGKAVGNATIKVITEDGGKTATCLVTVIQPIEPEEMIWVEGGTFMMGCTDGDDECFFSYEFPRHEVTLSGFYISKYVVTKKEWIATLGSSALNETENNLPAIARWGDTQLYINSLNALTGKNYRLPTEAEWEYAARGGNKGVANNHKYSGSNNLSEVADIYANNYYPVGQKKPNELGIYDMSGNIFEWCSDYYSDYTDVPQINPTGPVVGNNEHIVRGGAFWAASFFSRISHRGVTVDYARHGFRLVHP
ncbi:MAG: SUMF1/EgtB/PvdO family nonheme iron enzyme [Bacteroidetes bacterium]|nr:SUMF1/EgtB/PvdO family nonheme iron enzyme [Bacteroidota bacterium]MCL2302144.1 SUMF1/EgtB/PvdO family nonheme iron enzyme [Lentimicrobiaceae bacterium]